MSGKNGSRIKWIGLILGILAYVGTLIWGASSITSEVRTNTQDVMLLKAEKTRIDSIQVNIAIIKNDIGWIKKKLGETE